MPMLKCVANTDAALQNTSVLYGTFTHQYISMGSQESMEEVEQCKQNNGIIINWKVKGGVKTSK